MARKKGKLQASPSPSQTTPGPISPCRPSYPRPLASPALVVFGILSADLRTKFLLPLPFLRSPNTCLNAAPLTQLAFRLPRKTRRSPSVIVAIPLFPISNTILLIATETFSNSEIDTKCTHWVINRFLCPPPTAVMIGNHWWHETRRGDIIPPKAVISISGEPSPLESLTEWSTPLGKNFDVSDPPAPSTTTYMGRCIGKQLFITDYDDRKKKVEALVRVVQPADEQEGEPERLLGVFPSKPIKVISKPSKKRQSAKNLECKYRALCYFMQRSEQKRGGGVGEGRKGGPSRSAYRSSCGTGFTDRLPPFIFFLLDLFFSVH